MPFTGGTFIATENLINDKTFIVKNASSVTYTTTNANGPSELIHPRHEPIPLHPGCGLNHIRHAVIGLDFCGVV